MKSSHKNLPVSAIDLDTVDFLLSSVAQAVLQTLQQTNLAESQTLTLITELRRRFSPYQAGALLSLARLRLHASDKFPVADKLFFTAEALEQATAWPIAQQRAQTLHHLAPAGPFLDLGCGIGGDLLALAAYRPVIAIERDPLRLRFAQANIAAMGLSQQVTWVQGDWTEMMQAGALPAAAAAFADPSRRIAGRRVFSVEQMEPPLAALRRLQERIGLLGVKVMPGIQDHEIPAECGVEFVSHAGVCKEAVLWFGSQLHTKRWASVYTTSGWQTINADTETPPLGELNCGDYLHEPDPAIIRAHGFGALCARLNAHLFDSQIAYLISPPTKIDSFTQSLVQSFMIQEIHPFGLNLLNQRLQALAIGQVELKKRGFPVEPEELRPRLKLAKSNRPGVIIFTRRGDERLMFIGERLTKTRE